jgi:hypothetical protein
MNSRASCWCSIMWLMFDTHTQSLMRPLSY